MRLPRLSSLFSGYDWVLPVVVLVLTFIGLATIYSIDLSRGETLQYFPTQTVALILGCIVMLAASMIHVTVYQSSARLAYIGSLALLAGVLVFGVTIRGTTGWFRFGGFSFQPSEIAKVALILFLAWLIHRYGRQFHTPRFLVASAMVMLLPVGLIMLQPDLGSALILGGIWFLFLFFVGVQKRYIALIIGMGALVATVGWMFLFADYQKERLLTFIDPSRDALGSGYNVTQSIIAIGSGKLFGRGLGFGSQSQLHFLPEAQTDFIFAVIAEELGFVAVLVVFGLYFILLWRLMFLARQAQDDFRAFIVLGIALLFFIQVLINVGATVGLLPVTGVTLPFLSYGGSSLIINFLLIGIAESVARSTRNASH